MRFTQARLDGVGVVHVHAGMFSDRRPICLRVRSASIERSRRRASISSVLSIVGTSSATLLRKMPMPSASTSTTSPGFSQIGGSKRAPAPVGVPVTMTSPGTSVVKVEM